jgi:hypothetical protein
MFAGLTPFAVQASCRRPDSRASSASRDLRRPQSLVAGEFLREGVVRRLTSRLSASMGCTLDERVNNSIALNRRTHVQLSLDRTRACLADWRGRRVSRWDSNAIAAILNGMFWPDTSSARP